MLQQRWREALDCYETCQPILRKIGDRDSEVKLLLNLATVRGELGDAAGADRVLCEAARLRAELDDDAERPPRRGRWRRFSR
jgi:hypothetical protein